MIDVKDVSTLKSLPYSDMIGKYAFKVEPIRAVLENDYFIKMIEQAEEVRDNEIMKMKLGYSTTTTDEQEDCCAPKSKETEWDVLQRAPEAEYLLKTILPVLYQGMQVVDLQRPNNPRTLSTVSAEKLG